MTQQKFKDYNGVLWNYVSEEELQKMFPNGGFKVFSDMEQKDNSDKTNILEAETGQIALYPYKKKQSWLKRAVGYIPVMDETGQAGFIRIMEYAWYKLLIVIVAALVCASIFIAGIWFAKKDEVPGLDKTAISYHIDGVRNTDSESILLPGLSVLKAKENENHVKVVLFNPDGNECYFKYIIKLKKTGEILYSSGLIPPGKAVTEFNINRTLESGKYPIKVIIETRDINDQNIEYNAGNIDAYLEITK